MRQLVIRAGAARLAGVPVGGQRQEGARPGPAIAAAMLSNVVSAIPVFLVGANSVAIMRELNLTPFMYGVSIAWYFLVSAIVSAVGGGTGDRFGPPVVMAVGASISGTSLLLVALLPPSWGLLSFLLAVAGSANGLAQPASNSLLARCVQRAQQGLAFGLKQAAVPLATMLAGIGVPLVVVTWGWRWAFGSATVLPLAFLAMLASLPPVRTTATALTGSEPKGGSSTSSLRGLAIGAACASAAANGMAAFYVDAAVQAGYSESRAGVWFAVGGMIAVLARVVHGVLADRRGGGHFRATWRLMLAGGVGFVLLAGAPTGAARGFATVLAYGAAWGWPGLFNFAVVTQNPGGPAKATGVTQAGIFVGGIVGPPAFAVAVQLAGYKMAWLSGGAALAIAAATLTVAQRSIVDRP